MVSEFSHYNVFALDLETTGLNPYDSRILLCQIGFENKRYVINVGTTSLTPLIPFFESTKWLKIIQNAKFEKSFVKTYLKSEINNVFDTKLAENILGNPFETGLKALALKYANITLDKDVRTSFIEARPIEAFTQEQLQYASNDVFVLFPIWKAQREKLHDEGLDWVADLEFALTSVVSSMELEGVPIDVKKWRDKLENYKEEHEQSRLRLTALLFPDTVSEQLGMFVRDPINLNSPQQVKTAFGKIGIPLKATNEREIGIINHPAARELMEYRKLQKIMTSYGSTFLDEIHPFTNRIHADFQQIGTATGRFSCKSPNLQQMPEEFRECVSLKDHSLIVSDYSQIELRILGELSGDKRFLDTFASGHDLHKSTASAMFNIPIDSVTKEQRFIAKTINFGISYGMGANKLMDMLNQEFIKEGRSKKFNIREAQTMVNKYKATYGDVTRWLSEAGEISYRNGYCRTIMGRKRYFTRPDSNVENYQQMIASLKRQGANAPIQGTSADITKLAMLNLHKDLQQYAFRAKIIIQVHDEIVVLAHNRHAEAVKEVVEESMLKSAGEILKRVPVKVDTTISDVWKK